MIISNQSFHPWDCPSLDSFNEQRVASKIFFFFLNLGKPAA